MKTSNITVTDARLLSGLSNAVTASSRVSTNHFSSTSNIEIQTGILTRFFYDLDKAEVKLNNGNIVTCKLTRPVPDGLKFFYTPISDLEWDSDKKITYFAPLNDKIACIVLKISESYFLLSYYSLNVPNLPKPVTDPTFILGNYENQIEFGGSTGGVCIESEKIIFKEVSSPEQRNQVNTSDLTEDNILSKNYYTREEVNALLQALRDEFNTKLEQKEENND